MKAIDTNILVYAHRAECEQHKVARNLLETWSEGKHPWALPLPCLYEFLRVVTHPKVFTPPTSTSAAWRNIQSLAASPSLVILSQTERHLEVLGAILKETPVSGNLIHDAHIVALMKEHGIQEIVTNDGDFSRFKGIRLINPFH